MQKAIQTALATAFVTVAMGATLSCAADNTALPPKSIKYENFQDPSFDPAYSIAWDAMAKLYVGSEYEKGKPDTINPFLDIAQVDLNGDRIDEIIAVPVPSYPEGVKLCEPNQICPFYILEVRDRKVHTLGIIKAATVDRGNNIENGYWTLNVYQRDPGGNYTAPVTYVYDKKKDGFVPKPSGTSAVLPQRAPSSKP